MSRQVLGKRSHSSLSCSPSRSSPPTRKSRRVSVAIVLPSPVSTPNQKRAKTCSIHIDEEEGSNKENIPPDPIPGPHNTLNNAHSFSASVPTPTTTMTARELRAFRRASRISTPSSRRRASSSSPQSATSITNRTSSSPPSPTPVHTEKLRSTGAETPSKSLARLSLATPPATPGSSAMPTPSVEMKATDTMAPYTLIRAQLRPQINSSPLVGRENERKQILSFLQPFLVEDKSSTSTSLYISGAPGTGKTALVNEILASVASKRGVDVDVPLHALYVNCMTLGVNDSMTGIWERCLEQLGVEMPRKRSAAVTKEEWNERFGKLFRGKKCVLVLDEIDNLAPSTSIVQLFALASSPQARPYIRIIGISNVHTLTHTKDSPDIQTIHFEPYTAAQMKMILGRRLESSSTSGFDTTKIFPASAVALLTFRIASETGDIRTVFSVARRALDLVAATSGIHSTTTITPAHVLAAINASNACTKSRKGGAETVTTIRNLGLHPRFALAALLVAIKRIAAGLPLGVSGSSTSSGSLKENALRKSLSSPSPRGNDTTATTIELMALHGFYVEILSKYAHGAFRGLGRTEFGDLIKLLESSGLVEVTQPRGFGSRTKSPSKIKGTQAVGVASGVREEEIIRGLAGAANCAAVGDANMSVGDEEVKNIWDKEIRRLEKEAKAKRREGAKSKADFEDAEED